MIREAKETFQLLKTGVVLYLIGVAVLLLLGFVSHGEPGSFWQPGVAELQYEKFWKLQGGFEAGAAVPICSRPACWPSALSMAGNWRG